MDLIIHQLRVYEGEQCIWITEEFVSPIFKIDVNYMRIVHALFPKPVCING